MDSETLELKLSEGILRETPKLESGLTLLKIISAVAPLMGLLGVDLGPLGRTVVHRSYSHSLLMAPLIALPLALVWWALRRRRAARRRRCAHCSIAPVR